MWDWLVAHSFEIALVSGLMLGLGVFAVPWIVLRLPVDALRRPNPLHAVRRRHPVLRALIFLVRNVIGLPLLLLGVVMLFAPGQGILTILLALGIMEFPGKWRLEHAILERKSVYRTLNWIRRKGGRPPLHPPARV
jgi:hypothetical protein